MASSFRAAGEFSGPHRPLDYALLFPPFQRLLLHHGRFRGLEPIFLLTILFPIDESPNQALERTAPRVTPAAPPPSPAQPSRRAGQSLSLGSLGDSAHTHKMKTLTITLLLVGAVSIHAATFSGIGDLPGGTFSSDAHAVSSDGSTVVGAGTSASGGEAFRWTLAGGMVSLGSLGGPGSSRAFGISGDSQTIVGSGSSTSGNEAFRWTSGAGMTGLGDLSGAPFGSSASAISADGTTIVGFGRVPAGFGEVGQRAVYWPAGGGPVSIATVDSTAEAVSADGQTIVGHRYIFGTDRAFRWTLATGIVGLGSFPGGSSDIRATAVSADGSIIAGSADPSGGGVEAFRWTIETGVVGLGDLPGGLNFSYVGGISGDGQLIVGTGNTASGDESFIWDSVHGMRNLQSVLISEYGVSNLTGWTLSAATAISADGGTIVGNGINPSGQTEAWRVTGVPEPGVVGFLGAGLLLMLTKRRLRTSS